MSESLAEAFPKEQARCRELLAEYKALGPVGTFGAMAIEATLREADRAVAEQDPVAMMRAYERMRGHE